MKTVLITGASQGLGEGFAWAFAAKQYNLVLVARNQEKLAKVASDLEREYKIRAHVVPLDLAREGAADRLAEAVKEFPIEGLINNAGFGLAGDFAEQETNRVAQMVQLNVMLPTLLTHKLLPKLKERCGFVINIASTAAFQPIPGLATYAATKAYLLSWSDAIGAELRNSGVYVLSVCPGVTSTGFLETAKLNRSTLRLPVQTTDEVVATVMRAWERRQPLVISGWKNKVTAFSGRLLPRKVLLTVSQHLVGR